MSHTVYVLILQRELRRKTLEGQKRSPATILLHKILSIPESLGLGFLMVCKMLNALTTCVNRASLKRLSGIILLFLPFLEANLQFFKLTIAYFYAPKNHTVVLVITEYVGIYVLRLKVLVFSQ